MEAPKRKAFFCCRPLSQFFWGNVFPDDERVGYDPDEEYAWDCDGGSFGESELWDLLDEGEEDE